MTDRLYPGAKPNVTDQPTNRMRTHLAKKLTWMMCLGLALGAVTFRASAQLSVGNAGLAPQTFDSQPPATSWSTRAVGSSHFDFTNSAMIDAAVQTNTAASITSALVATAGTTVPAANGLAIWASDPSRANIMTRPTGNGMTLLMATLRNNSGSNLTQIAVSYNLTIEANIVEELPAHNVYWSLTGAAGSWQKIAGLTGVSGALSNTISLGGWANGTSMYMLFADDNATNAPDSAVELDNFSVVVPFPAITNQPVAQTVPPNNPATFSVGVTGFAPFTYQWRKNSNNITGATGPTYTISSVQAGDAGFYSVIVSNQYGTATSLDALLTVTCAPLAFTAQPSNQTVNAGTSVRMAGFTTGTAPVRYTWYKDGVIIPNATNSIYLLSPAGTGDSGTYKVAATNCAGGIVSTNGVLVVNCAAPVGFTSQPQDQTLDAGATFTLSITATGSPPIRYQWFHSGVAVAGATNATYSKTPAQTSDSGFWWVTASNCSGVTIVSSNAVVGVADAPYTLIGLTNYTWKYDQTGTNWDTQWKEIGFNDSGWASGRGIFAREDNAGITPLNNTVLNLSNATTARYVTNFYFRTHFTLTNDPAGVTLTSSNIFDDGQVVYLNGQEIYRMNMGGGTITATTWAPGTTTENVYWLTNFPINALVKGDNVLAVEVHQVNITSSDIVFGMHVNVSYPRPTLLSITNQPVDLSVEETKTATLTVGLSGAPAFYQWYKNGVLIPGATFNPLVIPVTSTNDAGTYYAVATNVINAVTSTVAVLTVRPDTNAPTLVEADGTIAPTSILVSFSELIGSDRATNTANYKVTNTVDGTSLTISKAVLTNGTNVLLTTSARNSGQNYILIVNNVRDVSPRQNVIATNSAIPVTSLITVFSLENSPWQFADPVYPQFGDVPDEGTAWRFVNYTNGPEWGVGTSPFIFTLDASYESPFTQNSPPATTLSQSDYVITYFRNVFSPGVSPSGAKVYLRHFVDDGAVFYFNGVEVLRTNMPAGAYDYTTTATRLVDDGTLSDPIQLPVQLLAGTNVLAVELHQITGLDTDKVFTASMDIRAQSFIVGPVIITSGPQDITVFEGQHATFSVTAVAGATFQWQQNSNNIAGATGAVYTIPAVPLSLDGAKYRVLVSNPNNSVTTTNATLHVVPDITPPTIVGASLNTNNATITVSFSEPLLASTANALGNYLVTNSAGQVQSASSAALANGTNVVLSFSTLPVAKYIVVVNNVRDASSKTNLIAANSAVVVGWDASIEAMSGFWLYNDLGNDLGTTWRALGYDDSAWSVGQALLGVKNGTVPANMPEPLRTTVALRNAGGNEIITYYFRTYFDALSSPAAVLTFRTIIDDGCVIYVNGTEVQRVGMPSGTVTATTLANRTVGDATDRPSIEGPFTVTVTNLITGRNVIAVEAHQVSATSSDMYWAGDFSISIPPVVIPAPVVPTNTCTNITFTLPTLTYRKTNGTNLVFTWTNPVTNTCGSNAIFVLQHAFKLTNINNNVLWTNIPWGGTSPVTITNVTTNNTRFFRLIRP